MLLVILKMAETSTCLERLNEASSDIYYHHGSIVIVQVKIMLIHAHIACLIITLLKHVRIMLASKYFFSFLLNQIFFLGAFCPLIP